MKLQMAKDSLFAILLRSPWWVSFLIAAGLFAAASLWLPGIYAFFIALPLLVIACYVSWQQLRAPSEARIAGTLEALRSMSWDEFSGAVEDAFGREGYSVRRLAGGPADLSRTKAARFSLVGCKRWKPARTGIEPLRELHAARIEHEAHECIHIAAGEISDNARTFATEKKIRLFHGAELVKLLPRIRPGGKASAN